MLLKGTLRAFDATAWTASVQVAGSLGSYLTGVPVSSAIPVWELVAGRTVHVAVPDGGLPADGLVVAVGGVAVGPPRCRVYNTTDTTVATATLLELGWDSEHFDTAGLHDPVTNNSRLTIPTAGVYVAHTEVWWQYNAGFPGGDRRTYLRVNGTSYEAVLAVPAAVGDSYQGCTLGPRRYVVGDYVEVVVWQSSGGSLTVYGSSRAAFGLWMVGT